MTIAYGLTEASPGITQTPRDDTLEHRTQTVGRVLPEMEVSIVDPGDRRETVATGEPRRALRARLQRDERLLQQRRRRRARRSTPTAGCAPAIRRRSTPTATCASRAASRTSSFAAARTSRRRRSRTCCASIRRSPTSRSTASRASSSARKWPRPCAPGPGRRSPAETLTTFCAARLARFKVPRHIRFVDEFPMTASGKIQKFKLREAHERELDVGPTFRSGVAG